jgi:hypothetical protein
MTGVGRSETVRIWMGSVRFGVESGRLSWPRSSYQPAALRPKESFEPGLSRDDLYVDVVTCIFIV